MFVQSQYAEWGGGVAPRAGEEIAAELIRRRQEIDQKELEFSCLAAQFAETDEYDWQGFESPVAWIKANCHLSGGAAGDRICVGEQLDRLGQSSSAMANGEIGRAVWAVEPGGRKFEGAGAISRTLRELGGGWAALGSLYFVPPLRWVEDVYYRRVARRRAGW